MGFVVFANSLFNAFVLDDPSQITANPFVQSLKNIPQFFLGSTFGGASTLVGAYYKPLMTTCFAVLYSIFGSNPFPFHIFQLLLHILNSILVFRLFSKFFSKTASLAASLIFLIHPINSEEVIYISDLQDTLFVFFGLLSLLVVSKTKLTIREYSLFSLLLLGSLLSKESGLLFVPAALAYRSLVFDKRLAAGGLVNLILACTGIVSLWVGLRHFAVSWSLESDHIFPIGRLPLLGRLINLPEIVFYYLKTFFFPRDLAVGQQWIVTSTDLVHFYLPMGTDLLFFCLLLVVGKLIFNDKKYFPVYLFFASLFITGLTLHLQIIPLDATVADRWFYFPSIGLLGIIALLIQKYNLLKSTAVLIVFLLLILVLSARAIFRNSNWKDGLTLARHDTQVNPDSFVMENNFGYELIQAKTWDEAEEHLKKSIDLAPYWWLNYNNLGVVYRHKGATGNQEFIAKAEENFRKASENTDTFYSPYENVAELLFNFQSAQAAKNFIVSTSKKLTLSENLYFLLSISEYQLGNKKEALAAASQAYLLNPKNERNLLLYQALQNNQTIQLQRPEY